MNGIPAPFPHPYAEGYAVDIGGGLWIWDSAEERWEIVEGGGPGSYEPIISFGTTAQYWRGDKQWTLLDKVAVGLANVDNTADANKPVSSATQSALNGKEPSIATGDPLKFWAGDKQWKTVSAAGSSDWADITNKPSTFPPSVHSHVIADTTGLQGALDGKAASVHTHAQADVTNLVTDLAGKAPTVHTHAQADVTNLVTDLAAKAPLASPVFTGNPTAPTPSAGDNDTTVATTAFVTTAVADVSGGGGLTRISKTTVSGTTVVALPTGYDKFVIEFVGLKATANVNPFIRFSLDGSTFLSTSIYYYGFMSVTGASTVAGAQASGTNFALFGSAPDLATAGMTASAKLDLFPGAASIVAQGYLAAAHWTGGAMRVSTQGLYFATGGRVLALQLSVSSGALTGGVIHLYGVPT